MLSTTGALAAHIHMDSRLKNRASPARLFFDDEHTNVLKVQRLGVTSILVDTSRGVDLAALEKGLRAYAAARQAA